VKYIKNRNISSLLKSSPLNSIVARSHVGQVLGHMSINNTMIYINLERALFKTMNNEFTLRAVSTLNEACKLVEVGSEYVTEVDGKKIFRKRK